LDADRSAKAIEASIIETGGGEIGPLSSDAAQATARSLAASSAPEAKSAIDALSRRSLDPVDRIEAATGSLAALEARLANTYRADERIRKERIETLMAMGMLLSGIQPDKAAETYRRVVGIAPEQALAHLYLGDLARASGEVDAAYVHYLAASASAGNDPFVRVESLSSLSYLAILDGDMDEAERLGVEALSHAEGSGDMPALAGARLQLARIYYREQDYPRVRKLCLLALDALGDADKPTMLATIHNTLGGVAYRTDDQEAAIAAFNHAADTYEAAGYVASAAWARGNIGVILSVSGQLDEAENYLNAAHDTAFALGNLERQAGYTSNLAKLYERRGNMAKSCQLTREAVKIYASFGSPRADQLEQDCT